MTTDPLSLDPELMRELGYRTVDFLVERFQRGSPGIPPALRREGSRRLAEPAPASGGSFDDILRRFDQEVLPLYARIDHPGFFGFIPGSGTWPGALADFISSALNMHVSDWVESPGPSRLELTVLDWFKDWIGYPGQAGGLLVSGGSVANLTALACAREARLGSMWADAVVYHSDQAHSSVARAARVLGLPPSRVRAVPVDDRFRIRPDSLERAIEADERAGLRPLFVAASAGTTNTGAVDPLGAIAEVCRGRGVWMHVDAAYGGFAVLTHRGAKELAGLDLADSVALDPHKWLYQPFECGCLLVRDGRLLERAFHASADYLQDTELREVNFADVGIQLTRGFRALKVWMSVHHFGVEAFRSAIDRCLDLARWAQRRIESSDELELLVPPTLSILCFRRHPPGLDDEDGLEAINARLVEAAQGSGDGFVSSTRLHGTYAIRLCVLNHATGQGDVERVLASLERAAPVASAPAGAGP